MNIKYLSLNEVQEQSLQVLKVIDEICSKNGFRYYLAYGTLLGAIRHKNVIPWDDDVDIWMPRDDYNKFVEYCNLNITKIKPLQILSTQNKDYPYIISRLSNSDYIVEENNVKPYGLGIFVDIYPLDGVGSDYSKAISFKRKVYWYVSLCFLSTRMKFSVGRTKGRIKSFLKYPAFILSKFLGKDYFVKKIEKFASLTNYSESSFVTCLVWGPYSEIKCIFKKEYFEKSIKVRLGKYLFNAPSNYDEILKLIYDDYMKLPPEEERVGYHFVKAYLKHK